MRMSHRQVRNRTQAGTLGLVDANRPQPVQLRRPDARQDNRAAPALPNRRQRTTLDHYRTFLLVVDTGSVSEAARRLGQYPPAVSRRIAAFEDHLGVALFTRRNRQPLVLTPAGADFLPYARRVGDAVAALVNEAARLECDGQARDQSVSVSS